MRKSWILLAATAPLAVLAGIGLPAIAASSGAPTAALSAAGALDLDKVPVKPVTGPLSVSGIADDDESDDRDDDGVRLRKARDIVHAVFADDDYEGGSRDDD